MNHLPIRLNTQTMSDTELLSRYFTQLEAWLNFQGMSANWYSDESLIIEHKLNLVPLTELENLKQSRCIPKANNNNEQLSDNAWQSLNLKLKNTVQDSLLFQSIFQLQDQQIELFVAFTPDIQTYCQKTAFSKNFFNRALFELAKRTRKISTEFN